MALVALGLLLPAPVLALADPVSAPAAGVTFNTPAPEPNTAPKPTPRSTPRPQASQAPTVPSVLVAPARTALSVGYSGASLMGQAPLLVAQEAGYFDDVGLTSVTVSRSPSVLADVLSGALDFAVVDAREAAAASANDPTFRAIAGYRNYTDGTYGGDVLVAAPGLVADEPATVIAFLVAYIRTLQDFSQADTANAALSLIEETDLAIDPALTADWTGALNVFAPFDGGFGDPADEGGLGELTAYLSNPDGTAPDLGAFIAGNTLSIAQALSGLAPNPANPLAGAPGITELTVGLPLADGEIGPIARALDAGYFADVGFSSVDVIDVEEPLLGVLQGQLDFGVIDAVDAADGSIQGLPLAALAGHRNYDLDGTYGGDLLVASSDVLAEEGATASAFLVAYVRALQELQDDARLAPFDGGFGARDQSGGLGELDAYLQTELNADPGLEALVQSAPLDYAQAWWGLPANPTPVADPTATEEAQ